MPRKLRKSIVKESSWENLEREAIFRLDQSSVESLMIKGIRFRRTWLANRQDPVKNKKSSPLPDYKKRSYWLQCWLILLILWSTMLSSIHQHQIMMWGNNKDRNYTWNTSLISLRKSSIRQVLRSKTSSNLANNWFQLWKQCTSQVSFTETWNPKTL